MSKMLTENDRLAIDMLVTPELFPIPAEGEVAELIGDDYVLVTDKDGAVREVVQGRHMILHFKAIDFANWIGERPFWLFNKDTHKFGRMIMSRSENEQGSVAESY